MATIFKRTNNKTGKKSGNYIIEYFDATGRRITKSSGTTDKAAAEQIARHLEAEVAKRKAGLIDPRQEAFALHAMKPLSEHLDAFEAAIESQAKANHVQRTRSKIDRIVTWCGWSILRDVEADGVNRFASSLRAANQAPATIRHYITAIRHFTKWATESGRLPFDVLVTVKKPNAKLDRKINRRALSIDELQWLYATTETEPTRYGMTGRERALVYRVAVMTGLRAGELRKLTRGNFRLTDDRPHIVILGDQSKNKRTNFQPVAANLVPKLLEHLRTKSKEASVFGLPEFDTADMVRTDMAAARTAWLATIRDPQEKIEADASDFLRCEDGEGNRIDFHALRHTSTTLYSSITDPKVTQEIARHGDFGTTFGYYVHAGTEAKQEAVETLAELLSGPDLKRATGTLDTAPQHPQQKQQQSPRFPLRLAATECDDSRAEEMNELAIESQENLGKRDDIQGDNESRTGRIRTCNQGIMSPLL